MGSWVALKYEPECFLIRINDVQALRQVAVQKLLVSPIKGQKKTAHAQGSWTLGVDFRGLACASCRMSGAGEGMATLLSGLNHPFSPALPVDMELCVQSAHRKRSTAKRAGKN